MTSGRAFFARSLQGKFLWGALLVIALVMATVIAVVEHRQRAAIIEEVRRRGDVLARSLAATSTRPLLLYDFTALEQDAARVANEADIVYAVILDAEGKIAADSRRPERVGLALREDIAQRAVSADGPLVQETVDQGEPLYDFAVPIVVEGQRWGTVRIGVSKRRMEAEIRKTRGEFLAVTALMLALGGLAAAVVARRIAGPVRQLAEVASAISRGELNHRIEPRSRDEIGALAIAFNDMAAQLRQQRSALEDAHVELRQRFDDLRDLKSYTDSILRSLTSGVVTIDLDGRIVTLNPAAEMLTGFFAGEAAGRYSTEVFAQTPEIGELLMETLSTHAGMNPIQIMLKRRNGTFAAVEFSTAPLRAGEGKELGIVGMFRDLTVVRELESRLRRSDRLAVVGTVAAGLAHEIKNPLTSLLTFSRHLARRFDDAQFREKFLRVVPRELERINGIVERLLELSRPAQLTFEPLRVSALVERAVELYANQLETRRIRVTREYGRDVPRVHADSESLYRALVNLVGNALDALDVGGRLTLRVRWEDVGATHASVHRGGRRIRIEIEDDGAGIDSADADRVFTPFFTTKEAGTGLGLALTHKIIEDHGGAIDFTSTPGRGTTFRILLPVRPGLPRPALSRGVHGGDELE